MAERGPKAHSKRRAREELASKPRRRFPWREKGLSRAEQLIRFCQWLPISKGRKLGRMRLLPYQVEFLENAFSEDGDGALKYALAILSTSKAQGKSEFCAALILAYLVGPCAIERGEVYAASVTQKKAARLFTALKHFITRVPEFHAICNILESDQKVTVQGGPGKDSYFECLAPNLADGSGLAPVFWCYDETGEASDSGLLSVLRNSEGKQKETLGICISTQGPDSLHFFSQLIDTAHLDPSVYCQVISAPDDLDAFSDEALRAANPAAGIFQDWKSLTRARDTARANPLEEAYYRRYRLNQRYDVKTDQRILPAAVWKSLAKDIKREELKGRVAYCGIDLSAWDDLSSLCLAIPGDGKDPEISLLSINWTPADAVIIRRPAEAELFRQWINQGHLTAIPGRSIRLSFVAAEMRKLQDEFKVKVCFFDRHKVKDLKLELDDVKCTIPLEEFGQGFVSMGPAVQWFSELALSGKLRHGDNPVLNAAISAAVITHDAAFNRKPDKEKSRRGGATKIDPLAAALMAVAACKQYHEEKTIDLSAWIAINTPNKNKNEGADGATTENIQS